MINKKSLILITAFMLLFIIYSGCTQNEKTITVNQMLYDINTNISSDYNTLKINYSSYNENDTIIINDQIENIEYDSDNDSTVISFFSNVNESIFKSSDLIFKGDLTDTYNVDDNVEIKLTIKHVLIPISFGDDTFYYDVEIFKEQWVSEDYFISNVQNGFPFKPMSDQIIIKK